MINIGRAKWIWESSTPAPDEHAEFVLEFDYKKSDGALTLSLSADSDYGIYLNGKLFAFGQYPDYPHYKIYDSFDITSAIVIGKNRLAVEVWYYGNNCSTNIDDGAGLCFSLDGERGNIAISDEKVLSRLSKCYRSHVCRSITPQLGYTYAYDAEQEDGWILNTADGFTPSAVVTPDKPLPTYPRPIKRLERGPSVQGRLIKSEQDGKFRYLFDFGEELVGIFSLRFDGATADDIELCYGEHIVDGWVRDKIHSRRFIIDYRSRAGKNDYFGYFRRLGLRYAELRCSSPLENIELEIHPLTYPLRELPFDRPCGDERRIYDICVRTLRLCLHDHYEDCPWREQAMYVLDSRNQMLCGYYAFGEYDFPRSAIRLMAVDRREDGLMSITYPGNSGLVIPSFCLHFFQLVREYGTFSGDWEFVRQILPRLLSLHKTLQKQISDDGVLLNVYGPASYWNFYEWETGLDGVIGKVDDEIPDLVLNALYSLALKNMQYICDKLEVETDNCYEKLSEKLNLAINRKFFNPECSLYGMLDNSSGYSELGNSLAILCGAAQGETAKTIAEQLTAPDNGLAPITLSMKCFKYDACLSLDEDKYAPFVLDDIRRVYLKMLDAGASSVWETEKGEADFDRAGSLCHGWSAMPVYYYHRLLK